MPTRSPPSRLAENLWVVSRSAAPTRLLIKLRRSYRHLGPSTLDPFLIRDRRAARESLERTLAWDFDRIVFSHGDVLESGRHDILRRGYS